MKISIKKIDGVFYCDIMDIARFKTRKGERVTPYQEIINLYKNGMLMTRIPNVNAYNYDTGIISYKDIISNNVTLNDCTLFTSDNDLDDGVLLQNEVYKVALLNVATPSNKSISINEAEEKIGEMAGFFIDAIYTQNSIKPSVFLTSQNRKLELLSVGVSDDFLFLVKLVDVYGYLIDIVSDGDFCSDHDITVGDIVQPPVISLRIRETSNSVAKKTTLQDKQYLYQDNKNHAPLLAVAIDIWERIFIHDEGNSKIGLEPRAIALIEMHYPSLTTNKEKNSVAYIATAHLGKTEKSNKNKNKG